MARQAALASSHKAFIHHTIARKCRILRFNCNQRIKITRMGEARRMVCHLYGIAPFGKTCGTGRAHAPISVSFTIGLAMDVATTHEYLVFTRRQYAQPAPHHPQRGLYQAG